MKCQASNCDSNKAARFKIMDIACPSEKGNLWYGDYGEGFWVCDDCAECFIHPMCMCDNPHYIIIEEKEQKK